MRHSLSSVKKLSLALGVAGIGILAGLPALAQSTSTGESPEFELSKEGFIILCERTPLNSRCEGSPYYAGSSSQSPDENPAFSPSGTTAPTQNLPSETDETEPSSAAETRYPDGTMQDGTMQNGTMQDGSMQDGSSGSSGTTGSPSNTTAPTENLPSESESPSTQEQSPSMMQGGSSSGSSGTTGSPSNTTAPTQTLPSETDGK